MVAVIHEIRKYRLALVQNTHQYLLCQRAMVAYAGLAQRPITESDVAARAPVFFDKSGVYV
jgi:hypothetical protein